MSSDDEIISSIHEDNDVFSDPDEPEELEEIAQKDDAILAEEPIVREDYRMIMIEPVQQTTNRISLFEYTELTGIRAEEIARFNNCYVPIDGLTSPIDMADREFMMRKCPLKVKRFLGFRIIDGHRQEYYEYIDPNEAIHPTRAYNV